MASIKDLRGKKVAANTSAEITLSGLLATQNMTEKDIDYLNLGPTEMAPALAKGDVVAACVWQPLLDGLKKAAPDGKLLGLDTDTTKYQKFGTMASPDIMIISRKLVEQHPDQARGIALGMLKGADYTIANPEDAAKTVAHYFKQDAGRGAGWHEAAEVFRHQGVGGAHEAARRADAVSGPVVV